MSVVPTLSLASVDPAPLAVLDRLAGAFGEAAIAGLLHGLRDLLERASRNDDHAALADEAHRIAGLAGTLGFTALGQHWLCVADGRGAVTDVTLIATRQALTTIAHAEKKLLFTAP